MYLQINKFNNKIVNYNNNNKNKLIINNNQIYLLVLLLMKLVFHPLLHGMLNNKIKIRCKFNRNNKMLFSY